MAELVIKQLLYALVLMLISLPSNAIESTKCTTFPLWQNFKQHFISVDGRVIDPISENAYTTSEGQSYGMFFALVENDRALFAKLLNWSQNNLANGDLTTQLPAWQWGRLEANRWGISDNNSAADSDLWISYSLLEAATIWHNEHYRKLGEQLGRLILTQETAQIKGLGLTLLPAPIGFHPDAKTWRLNPSYLPIFLLRAMYRHTGDKRWQQLIATSQQLILASAPKGFVPDWIEFSTVQGWRHQGQISSYNAIRVYLWTGMMDASDPFRRQQLRKFRPLVKYLDNHGVPGEAIDILTGHSANLGPIGFSAALLPFLQASGAEKTLQQQMLRLITQPLSTDPESYYNQVLGIFSLGWMNKRFRFGPEGELTTCLGSD